LARRQGLVDDKLNAALASLSPEEEARAEERARFWPNRPPLNTTASGNTAPAPSG